ncbi:hypothetical protein [Mycolicibacterium fallax]|uniref:Uncharacterized protein n=1 Tax=Mycolicibacterium fallax TaxID=1793 RepID=A0A1X1R7Y7_MYCFA|nr:hypothetical protein [Mycolicibacterium fallax]ORV00969.1 hypothetical protein AWC04_14955 [Mycolicibacterium fallax]BBZ00524.1 hypothetical protein MFAL_39900 [Mycolicibacterium fallax]
MNDVIETYDSNEARSDAERLRDAVAALADVVDEVCGRVTYTDDSHDRERDFSTPDMDEARSSATALTSALIVVKEYAEQPASEMEEAADAVDENDASLAEEYCVGRFPLPDGYARWDDVPLNALPPEDHCNRMSSGMQFAARVARDPISRYVCKACGQHYRARNWVGPCDACRKEGRK